MSITAALASSTVRSGGTLAISGGKVVSRLTGLPPKPVATVATTTTVRTPSISGGTTGTVVIPVDALPTGGSTATPTTVATDVTVTGAAVQPEEKKIPWLHIGIGAGIIAAIVAAYFLLKKK